jgi:tetratricopeptide (TPR) repeat protein
MGRASLLMDDRDYEGAIQDYDRLLAVNKYYSPAFKQRGLAKMELRKFTEAITDFNQYLEIEDPDGYVVYQRGISKIYSNNLLQGCLDLSSAQELGFKDAEKAIKKFCE